MAAIVGDRPVGAARRDGGGASRRVITLYLDSSGSTPTTYYKASLLGDRTEKP